MSAGKFLFIFVSVSLSGLSQATLINPQDQATKSPRYVHCLSTNSIIQIKDPFDPAMAQDKSFIGMEWYRYQGEIETKLFEFVPTTSSDKITPLQPKFTQFEFWGLQINSVGIDDSATYKARMALLSPSQVWSAEIIVAMPPQLASDKLSMSVNKNPSSVTITCGQISSLGTPPVEVMLKANNGTVLPSVFRNGFMELEVSEREAEREKISCEVNMTSPAFHCVLEKDRLRWKGVFNNPITAEQGSMFGIIAGVAGAVVVLIIVIIIIVVVVMKKRKNKGKTYNAQDHERERADDFNKNNRPLLVDNDDHQYDFPSVTQGPIYKGPSAPGPYMVSKVQGNSESILKNAKSGREDKSFVNGDKSSQSAPGKFLKKGEEKSRKKQEKDDEKKEEQMPPRTKPRSIFLSPSMEELDKVSKAIASGDSSGLGGPAGTQV